MLLKVLKEQLLKAEGSRRHKNKVSDSVTECVCWWRSGISAASRVISRHPDIQWITRGQRARSLCCLYSSPHFHTCSSGKDINTLGIYGAKVAICIKMEIFYLHCYWLLALSSRTPSLSWLQSITSMEKLCYWQINVITLTILFCKKLRSYPHADRNGPSEPLGVIWGSVNCTMTLQHGDSWTGGAEDPNHQPNYFGKGSCNNLAR